MFLTARFVRRLALAVVAVYAFGLGTVALAACGLNRGALAHAAAGQEHTCECEESIAPTPSVSAGCVAHCTADLQNAGPQPPALAGWSDSPVLVIEPQVRRARVMEELPPSGPPRRILLHSFLV